MEMEAKQEKKRAIDIWKQKQIFQGHQSKLVKRLLKWRENRFKEQALYEWKAYSCLLEHSCRVRCLQLDITTKAYLSQLFSQMRLTLRNEKRVRQMYLNSYLKAWQDYVVYNRQLMQTNMAAIQFGQINRKYTLQACYNTLRQHTETKKHGMMKNAVEDDMDIAIQETEQFNQDKMKALLTSNQRRAGNIVRDMLAKRLYAYFMHWNNVGVNYN
jgi:hypothetical protein